MTSTCAGNARRTGTSESGHHEQDAEEGCRGPAKFSSSVTLFGHTLSKAACIGITCTCAVVFLALAVTGFGKPD